MAKVMITDVEKINYLMSAIAFFSPEGKVFSMRKVEGLDYHIQYINIMTRSFKELKEVLKDVDLKYYSENPNEVFNDIFPVFTKKGYAIYCNLAPNTKIPTNCAMMLLPEKRTKRLVFNLLQSEMKFSLICFYDIGIYDSKTEEFDSLIPDDMCLEEPNSYILYDAIAPRNQKQRKMQQRG